MKEVGRMGAIAGLWLVVFACASGRAFAISEPAHQGFCSPLRTEPNA
jgi:hypothetical protein